jgi:hypothetical protein
MNSRYTLALALLLSSLPAFTRANDHDCLRNIELKSGDIEAAVIWLASEKLPDFGLQCPIKDSIKREVILDRVDAHITHGALALDVDLPSAGSVAVITNDESLHVLWTITNGLLAHKATNDILSDAGKTYVSEKLVSAALWVLTQTNVEGLLPDSITSGRIYNFIRKEAARCGVSHLIQKACNK